jgi:hypothetical protein
MRNNFNIAKMRKMVSGEIPALLGKLNYKIGKKESKEVVAGKDVQSDLLFSCGIFLLLSEKKEMNMLSIR